MPDPLTPDAIEEIKKLLTEATPADSPAALVAHVKIVRMFPALLAERDRVAAELSELRTERQALRRALVSVVVHCGRPALPSPDLLNGLLDSCDRIARTALALPESPKETP